MNLSLKKITSILNAKEIGNTNDLEIDIISIDSRSLQNNEKTLFFALTGVNHDAHIYIKDLITKGVRNFVVTHIPEDLEGEANFLVVKNTLGALQQTASYYRSLFSFPIIGVTGSNGKTIVKEWLNFLLSPDYNIIRSPKSYNSQVGVPLSVLAINEQHNLGIFEAGISTVSEMDKLQKIIQPTIGILTNIGSAHDEGFANLEEKIKEKMLLFQHSEVVIYQKSNSVEQFISTKTKAFSWSFTDSTATVFIVKKEHTHDHSLIDYTYKGNVLTLKIPFVDDASIENVISCLLVLLYLEYDSKHDSEPD